MDRLDVKQPLIVEIKRNALDDGPGIRTTVFFKGCPLGCSFCHNPECIYPQVELSYREDCCIGCMTCQRICSKQAIGKQGPFHIYRDRCDLCSVCVDACPAQALEMVGKSYSIDQLTHILLKDKFFYFNSKGGVTLSGGEPTLYLEYCSFLARALKEEGIHLMIETCGFFLWNSFEELLLPYLDLIYIDLKILDTPSHIEHCVRDNSRIIDNIRKLASLSDIEFLVRVPLVPNITATPENLSGIASFLKDIGQSRIGVIPYHPLWLKKARGIGRKITYSNQNPLSQEERKVCRSLLEGLEIVGDL